MWKMTTKRFNTEQVIGFNDTTESVNIVPASGVSFTVSYKEGDSFVEDDAGSQTAPIRVYVQNTVVKITPTGGFVTVTGAGSFE